MICLPKHPYFAAVVIHPTAIISSKARISQDVEVGPYCVIGDDVELGSGCVLHSQVNLQGPSRFGKDNLFHPFCVIGGPTQDLKYQGEPTWLEVGDGNSFREFVTVNRGTALNEKTIIGSHNHFLAYSHVAHNCTIGSHCVFSNNATFGGHVTVGDYVTVGGLAAFHQFCRIGNYCMVGGCSKIIQDIPPYFLADGNPAQIRAINKVGLQRKDFSDEKIRILLQAHRTLFNLKLNTSQAIAELERELGQSTEVQEILAFIKSSDRGIIR